MRLVLFSYGQTGAQDQEVETFIPNWTRMHVVQIKVSHQTTRLILNYSKRAKSFCAYYQHF